MKKDKKLMKKHIGLIKTIESVEEYMNWFHESPDDNSYIKSCIERGILEYKIIGVSEDRVLVQQNNSEQTQKVILNYESSYNECVIEFLEKREIIPDQEYRNLGK